MLTNNIELFDSAINYNSKSNIVKNWLFLFLFLIFIILIFFLDIIVKNITVNFGG